MTPCAGGDVRVVRAILLPAIAQRRSFRLRRRSELDFAFFMAIMLKGRGTNEATEIQKRKVYWLSAVRAGLFGHEGGRIYSFQSENWYRNLL